MIVSYVIGANGNLIHMKHTQSDHMALYALGDVHIRQRVPGFNRYKLGPLPPPDFRQAICVAAQTEDAAYAEANSKDQSVHTGQTPEFEIERNATRHMHCACCGPADLNAVPEKLHLALFASCRQLYHLATTTLYPNNTFSFDDALSFTHFLANLDPNQKSMIRSLHLSRPSVDISVRTSNRTTWMHALQPSSIRTLQGLRTVHLCLDMNIHTPNSRGAHTAYKIIFLEADLEPFLQLRVLPLTKATVMISDDVSTFMSMTGESSLHGRWTVAEKNVWAEKTRLKLLEPCVEDAEGAVVPGEEVANGMSITDRVRRIFQRVDRRRCGE